MLLNVYLAECPERAMLKIGGSREPERRVRELVLAVPGEWLLVCWFDNRGGHEAQLHRQLAAFRHPEMAGREWYRDCAEVRAAFEAARQESRARLRARVKETHHDYVVAKEAWRRAREALARAG